MPSSLVAASYFGSKGILAPWIVQHLPHHDRYYEPFAGVASVLLNKPRCSVEIISDLNETTINFLRVVQTKPAALIEAIAELAAALPHEVIASQLPVLGANKISDAAYFFLYCQVSRSGGGTNWASGIADTRNTAAAHLWQVHRRLQNVQVQVADAFQIIDSTPLDSNTLLYIDPPYLHSTRGAKDQRLADPQSSVSRRQYQFELTDAQHIELAKKLQGRCAVVSGRPSSLYDQLYEGWHTVSKPTQSGLEVLWISPIAFQQLPQTTLFRNYGN